MWSFSLIIRRRRHYWLLHFFYLGCNTNVIGDTGKLVRLIRLYLATAEQNLIFTEDRLQGMIKTVPIKKNYEFLKIYKKGRFYVGKFIILYVLANNLSINRLGITVSKKIGKSVKRNRLKRLIRESYRVYENFTKDGCDYLFVARSSEVIPEFADVRKEMKFLLKKLDVFDREKWDCSKQQ